MYFLPWPRGDNKMSRVPVDAHILMETERAIAIEDDTEKSGMKWIPKSLCDFYKHEKTQTYSDLEVEEWFAKKEGLI